MILGREHQAIIPSYTPSRFCNSHTCGNITRWGIDVHRGGKKHQNVYTLDLQVWRPSPTVNNSTGSGCYSLVGNNTFTKISLLLPNQVAMVTPSPQDYIQFRPGDMLGFYVSSAPGASTNDGVVALTSGFSSELLWYASIAPSLATSRCGNCPYSVGRNGVLDMTVRGAPVISVCVGKYSRY